MVPLIAFFGFIYGTLLGSFLNVCIYRLPRGSSIVFARSSCTTCKQLIHWWQNIPILSYLFLGGKCAQCGSPISLRYLFVEILTGVLMAFLWRHDIPNAFSFTCHLVFVSLLIVITVIDLDFQYILDYTVYAGIAAGFLCSGFSHHLLDALAGAGFGVAFLYSIRVVGEFVFLREAMGGGDVLLAAMLGSFLGFHGMILCIFLSTFIGVLIGLGSIGLGFSRWREPFAFGPALALAGFVTMFWGDAIFAWYLNASPAFSWWILRHLPVHSRFIGF